MITIINYGMGNLGSIQNMFRRIGVESRITDSVKEIDEADKILLPGVGAFDAAMERIDEGGFRKVLNKKALEDRIPVLGVCLGMQLLTDSSEEGVREGLGWIPGKTKKFNFSDLKLKVPHMGWNRVHEVRSNQLINDLPDEPRFYFVHSYFVQADDEKDVLAVTNYGQPFHSIVNHQNIYGAQFHPEKSHKFGMKLLENFAKL